MFRCINKNTRKYKDAGQPLPISFPQLRKFWRICCALKSASTWIGYLGHGLYSKADDFQMLWILQNVSSFISFPFRRYEWVVVVTPKSRISFAKKTSTVLWFFESIVLWSESRIDLLFFPILIMQQIKKLIWKRLYFEDICYCKEYCSCAENVKTFDLNEFHVSAKNLCTYKNIYFDRNAGLLSDPFLLQRYEMACSRHVLTRL